MPASTSRLVDLRHMEPCGRMQGDWYRLRRHGHPSAHRQLRNVRRQPNLGGEVCAKADVRDVREGLLEMTRSKTIMSCAALLAAIVAAVWAMQAGASTKPDAPHVITITTPKPSDRLADTAPGIIRMVAMPKDEGSETGPIDIDSATRLVDVNHRGPLGKDDAASLRRSCENYLVQTRKKFEERTTDSQDSAVLLEEANLHYSATLAEVALKALDSGSYVVLSQSDPLQLSLPGAELLTTGAMQNGEQVNINIVMSLDAYPDLREVRNYLDDMQLFDDSEKARKFNERPDLEREQIVARIRSIQAKPDRTRADRDFLENTLGFNTHFKAGGNILYAVPVK